MARRVLVTGHRGAAGLEPENTLRSFRRACDLGVDRVETDIHLTRDGVPVCIHDARLDRTTNGSGLVQEQSLDEIRRLDAGRGERIPTLAEALAEVRGHAVFKLELKGEGTPAPTVAAIEAAGMSPEEVMVISFDEALVAEARSLRAGIPRGLIFSNPPADAISRALRLGARELMVHFESATPGLVQSAHAAGVALGAWTVNERADMERILALGVDDIGSDRPDILVELLREKGRG